MQFSGQASTKHNFLIDIIHGNPKRCFVVVDMEEKMGFKIVK
jgi:hypothetical protein